MRKNTPETDQSAVFETEKEARLSALDYCTTDGILLSDQTEEYEAYKDGYLKGVESNQKANIAQLIQIQEKYEKELYNLGELYQESLRKIDLLNKDRCVACDQSAKIADLENELAAMTADRDILDNANIVLNEKFIIAKKVLRKIKNSTVDDGPLYWNLAVEALQKIQSFISMKTTNLGAIKAEKAYQEIQSTIELNRHIKELGLAPDEDE